MFKLTKEDLAKKSDAQLASLFQQASNGLCPSRADLTTTLSLLAMIRAELARRGPRQ
jgi:hypothetical protein